jgi:hypothetical protein
MFGNVVDTHYIHDYKNLLTTRFYTLFQDITYSVYHDAFGTYDFKPYVPVRFGIAGFYKWFGLGLSLGFPFTRNNYEKYVHSDIIDLRILAYSKIGTFECYYQKFKGFYIQGVHGGDGTFYDLPDMTSISAGFVATYTYNFARFSLRSAWIQNERQKHSAGSLLMRPSITYYQIRNDSVILPSNEYEQVYIPDDRKIVRNESWSFGLAPGYGYTFVFARYMYIHSSAFAGVNYQTSRYTSLSGTTYSGNDIVYSFLGRFSIGYNSDKWFIGGSYVFNFYEGLLSSKYVQSLYKLNQIRFWVGTRFNAFGKGKRKK